MRPPDFVGFFAGHPQIRAVLFNGKTARSLWDRRVAGNLPLRAGLALVMLRPRRRRTLY